jgi:hypothetical protein
MTGQAVGRRHGHGGPVTTAGHLPAAPTGLPSGTRVVVTAGDPTHEEVLAVLLALDQATSADADVPAPPPPAWLRAARQEAVGGPAAATPADLRGWGR